MNARVVVLNGPPGAGKSTVGRLLAAGAANGACIHGDDLARFVVRRDGSAERGLGYTGAGLLAANFVGGGYELVVVDYVFERARHVQRLAGALAGAAPLQVVTLWAPLAVLRARERGRPGRRPLGERVERCYRSMEPHLGELGRVVSAEPPAAEVATTVARLLASGAPGP